nr:hypothetical protein [Megavirus caiporensis]
MKIFICFIVLNTIIFVSSFQLKPVIVSAKNNGIINIEINPNINLEKMQSLISQNFKSNIYLNSITTDFINTISNEIYLAMGIDGVVVNHLKWNFNIIQSHGFLYMYSIKAHITNNEINISYQTIKLTQEIPVVYDSVQKCAKTGARRYVVAGPRDLECHTHYVPRGLNQNELNIISNNLMAAANNIKLIN